MVEIGEILYLDLKKKYYIKNIKKREIVRCMMIQS